MASEGPGTSNALVTENLIPPNVNDDKLIKCQPGDNESDIIEVPFKQIKQSHTFFNMFRDLGCEVDAKMASEGQGTSNALVTENLISPNVNDDKLIKCQPGDNESDIIEVPFKQIKQSHTFFNMFRDLGCEVDENFVFPMPAVKPEIFQKIVDWTANHIDLPDPEVKEDPSTRERIWFTLTDYENKFYDVSVDIMSELLTAANYLDIKHLYLYGCQKLAELIKDKSPEAIRELLGLEDDLTPEEKEEIKKQNVWCNYD